MRWREERIRKAMAERSPDPVRLIRMTRLAFPALAYPALAFLALGLLAFCALAFVVPAFAVPAFAVSRADASAAGLELEEILGRGNNGADANLDGSLDVSDVIFDFAQWVPTSTATATSSPSASPSPSITPGLSPSPSGALVDFRAVEVFLMDASDNRVDHPQIGQQLYPVVTLEIKDKPYAPLVTVRIDALKICEAASTVFEPGLTDMICTDPWTVTPGFHMIEGILDEKEEVPESNESNNIATYTFTTIGGGTPVLSAQPLSLQISCSSQSPTAARALSPLKLEGIPLGQSNPPVGHSSAPAGIKSASSAPGFHLDPNVLRQISRADQPVVLESLSLGRLTAKNIILEPYEIFADGAEIVTFDGAVRRPVARPAVRHFKGYSSADKDFTMFVSIVSEEELWLVQRRPEQEPVVIVPQRNANGEVEHLSASSTGPLTPGPFCHFDELPENIEGMGHIIEPPPRESLSAPQVTLEIKGRIDITYALFNGPFHSSTDQTMIYMANLMAVVSGIFERDVNVKIAIGELVIWTAQDPFGSVSSRDQLANYKSYITKNPPTNSPAYALVLGGDFDLGGLAYLGKLCNPAYYFGLSNITGDVYFPSHSYAWDFNEIAHELGHLFNSLHTHCYSPPIDCCSNLDCPDHCPTTQAQVGTIMSYCQLNGSVSLYFHARSAAVMRAYSETLTCLTSATPPFMGAIHVTNTGTDNLYLYSLRPIPETPWLVIPPVDERPVAPGGSAMLAVILDCAKLPTNQPPSHLMLLSNSPANHSQEILVTYGNGVSAACVRSCGTVWPSTAPALSPAANPAAASAPTPAPAGP